MIVQKREARPASAREVALLVIRDVFGEPPRGGQASFDYRVRAAKLDDRDRAFAAELAYGTIKMRRTIDWYLAPYIAQRREKLPASIADILRLGIYQLRMMSGVDAHAAVFETVSLARKYGHKGTVGLVNAVLRRFQAGDPPAPEAAHFTDRAEYLGLRYSLPTWVVRGWIERFGEAHAEDICAGVDRAPQLALRVDLRSNTIENEVADLRAAGWAAQASDYVADCVVVIRGGGRAPEIPGRRVLQSEAACMPVDLLDPRPGETVLDLCSGRGNKLLQIALRLNGRGSVTGIDVDAQKVAHASAVLAESGISNAGVATGDAALFESPQADAVLLDAPCSGLGVLGRHPEARWRKTAGDGARLAPLQLALLRNAFRLLRPGGRLVYSVCTTDPREAEDVISALAAEGVLFERIALPVRYRQFACGGDAVIPPGIDGRDGFFIALLKKSE